MIHILVKAMKTIQTALFNDHKARIKKEHKKNTFFLMFRKARVKKRAQMFSEIFRVIEEQIFSEIFCVIIINI